MKELTQHIHDNITVSVEKQYPKQQKHLGSINLHRGLSLFELNLKTKLIALAEFANVDSIITDGTPAVHKKVLTKEGCLYAVALNRKNAERKFAVMLNKHRKANAN